MIATAIISRDEDRRRMRDLLNAMIQELQREAQVKMLGGASGTVHFAGIAILMGVWREAIGGTPDAILYPLV